MKIKRLLLVPFLLSGCVDSSKVYDPFKETKDNPIVYDEVNHVAELDCLNIEPKEETNLMLYPETYAGVNVGPILNIGGFDSPDQEHCPFKPEFKEILNDAFNSSSGGRSDSSKLICSETFDGICSQFIEYFAGGAYEYYLNYSGEERTILETIKKAAVKKYLANMFKHTLKNYDEENKSYYIIARSIGYYTLKSRALVRPRDYYTDQYLADLKSVLSLDNLDTYYALFDKYGTEYISNITYVPADMAFVGMSCKEYYGEITCSEYNGNEIYKVIKDGLANESRITMDDFWMNNKDRSLTDDNKDRVIHYATTSFYNKLPEGYSSQDEGKIKYAYDLYREKKLAELNKEINKIVETKDVIKDGHHLYGPMYKGETGDPVPMSKDKPFIKSMNLCGNLEHYDPRVLFGQGFDTVYVRPKILMNPMNNDFTVDAKIMIGDKKIHALDNVKYSPTQVVITSPWYEIKTKNIQDPNSLAILKVSSDNKDAKLLKCELELVYTR